MSDTDFSDSIPAWCNGVPCFVNPAHLRERTGAAVVILNKDPNAILLQAETYARLEQRIQQMESTLFAVHCALEQGKVLPNLIARVEAAIRGTT
jgi:hypothetical protein